MSYLEQEIAEQPQVVAQLLDLEGEHAREIARAIQRRAPAFVVIAARGTSGHAATYGKYLLASTCGLPVALAAPSLYTIYHTPPRLQGALVIGISQSGHSPDIVEVVAEARRQGAMTLSITNDPQSPLGREAECCLPCHAGQERSVAATKTYTAQLTALALVGAALAGGDAMWAELQRLPEWLARVLQLAPEMQQRVERYRYMDAFATIGRGYNYATAFEVNLKIKELCYIAGESYSEADFRHGPIAVIDRGFPVIVIAPAGKTLPALLDLLDQLHGKGAELLVISNDEAAFAHAQQAMRLPAAMPEWLTPITAVVHGQVFAMRLALVKGYEVDSPRGLTKVTVTR